MSYPAQIPTTTAESPAGWMASMSGPYTNGVAGVRYLFFSVVTGIFPTAVSTMTAFKSTDSGQTWAVVDGANSPVMGADRTGLGGWNTFLDPTGNNKVWISYPNPVGIINSGARTAYRATAVLNNFDMNTDTWGVAITGGPTLYAQVGNSNNADNFGSTLFVYANGDIQLLYQSAFENLAGTNYDRVSTALYSGGWGAPQAAFGVGETTDYSAMNMVLGDAARVHLFAIGTAIPSFPAPPVFGDRKIHHKALNAGVLGVDQVVTSDIVPAPAQGGGGFVSSAVTRPNGAATELLIGILRPATLSTASYVSWPAIMRADSADNPVWTEEFVNSDVGKESTEQFVNAPVMVVGSDLYVVWSANGDQDTWYSLNSGGGWGAAVNLFNDPGGLTGQYNNGRGFAAGFGYTTLDSDIDVLEYFELAAAPPAVVIPPKCELVFLLAVPDDNVAPGPAEILNPKLDSSYADYWGEELPLRIAAWRQIVDAGCYVPRWFQVPDNGLEELGLGEYRSYTLFLPPGSFILQVLHTAAASQGATFMVQVTDSVLDHQWFDQPIPDVFFYKRNGRNGYVFPKPYPVIAPGLFTVEFWRHT